MYSRIAAVDSGMMNCPVFYLTPLQGWTLNAEMDRTFNSSGSLIKRVAGNNESMRATFQLEFGREYRYNQMEEQMKAQIQQMQAQMNPMVNIFGFSPFGMPQAPVQNSPYLPGMQVCNQVQQPAFKQVQGLPPTTLPVPAVDYLHYIFKIQNLNLQNAHDEKIVLLEELMQTKKDEFDNLQIALQKSLQELNAFSGAQMANQIKFDSAQMSVLYEQNNQQMIYFSEVLLTYTYFSVPFMNGMEISWRQPALSLITSPVELLEEVKNQANAICATYEEEPKYLELLEQSKRHEKSLREKQERHDNEMLRMTQQTNEQINNSIQGSIQKRRASNAAIMDNWTRILSR